MDAMRTVDIIIEKRDRQALTTDEINYFIEGFAQGKIPDYQAAALAMAILINGMNEREIIDLTLAMANSGEVLDLRGVVPFAVDKHSTGGVGDKTTLVVEPIVAACGLPIGKMSGRGLGFSGGTLDKLESIPGFRTNLTTEEFLRQLKSIGMVLTGQTADLAPADGKLYALRDVTGTVQSLPLIAASVMSKKIAAGAQGIVLDVKWGVGAFMPGLKEARKLARLMVVIATLTNRKAVALLSGMNQPLGHAIGNALELKEAIETLHNRGPEDFREHCLVVTAHLLSLGNVVQTVREGEKLALKALSSGDAWERFRLLVQTQGGDVSTIDHPEKLPIAPFVASYSSQASGYIEMINARTAGETAVMLGAGRAKKEDSIDHAVGIIIPKKVGDFVKEGEKIFEIHARRQVDLELAMTALQAAIQITQDRVKPLRLFDGVIRG
jgi:pyrimidine-nucleoside phosphorylase